MTHRVFSRNAASSRAIPIERMRKAVMENPAVPEYWGANQKGMQAAERLTGCPRAAAEREWLRIRTNAVKGLDELNDIGVHKQIANRVIEPWNHITVLASATDYHNFFSLRAHKDAQPEFQVLAYTMLREYLNSWPQPVATGDWHIPFGDRMPEGLTLSEKLKVATARAARLSYLTFEGTINVQKDFELHDDLAAKGHWSPFEHCAEATPLEAHGNFRGWRQYRKQFINENPMDVDLEDIWAKVPDWVLQAIDKNDNLKSE